MSEMKDSADSSADAYVAARLSRADKVRTIQNEIDDKHALKGGRNNPIHSTVPGADSPNAQDKAMAQHSADFIAASVKKNRAGMEAARQGFHAVRAAAGRTPKGLEAPCSGAGCVATTTTGATNCGKGDCGVSLDKNVSRPRG